ncbi:MAG: hypothetical protein ABWZ66_13035 [Pyrinomonadaceae bacterium]
MNIYVMSIMAFSLVPGEETKTLVEHLPGIVPANSIEAAAEEAKLFALKQWKVSGGWFNHQVTIMPAAPICYAAVDAFRERGIINPDSGEKTQLFQLDAALSDGKSE